MKPSSQSSIPNPTQQSSSSELPIPKRLKENIEENLEKDILFSKTPVHSHDHPKDAPPKGSGSAVHAHIHSEESLRKIVNRLSRLEGHIRGIKTMVQENRPCPDVLVQVAAVRGGIDRVARVILDEHLSECMTRAANEGNLEAEMEALKTALDRFIS